jgi:hypothetical protein
VTSTARDPSGLAWRLSGPTVPLDTRFEPLTVGDLTEISEFRGALLFADGRRPSFSTGAGRFRDVDPNDRCSFHVTVRERGALVACVRATRLGATPEGTIEHVVGRVDFASLLQHMSLARERSFEGSRWIVAPKWRGSRLGKLLLVSLWAIGRRLGGECLFGAAGTRDGQATLIRRMGGAVADLPARHVATLDDEILVTYFDLDHPPPYVLKLLPEVEGLLGIPTTRAEDSKRARSPAQEGAREGEAASLQTTDEACST